MNNRVSIVASLSFLALTATSGSAAIIGVTGATTQIAPPVSCVPGALVSPLVQVWDEAQNRGVPNLLVDMTNNPGASGAPIPGVIGGVIDSHLIHFDDLGSGVIATGTVTFNNPIIGVDLFATSLDATDGPFGAPGTTYPTFFPFRDLTFNTSFFSISGSSISFTLDTLFPGALSVTQIRVFTRVPTPGGVALAGIAGLAVLRRRRVA